MLLSAATVAIIERRFRIASLWFLVASLLSTVGLMHSYQFTPGDATMVQLTPALDWATGYALMAGITYLAVFLTEPNEGLA